MNWVNEILPGGLIEALGWTFFHSLWLGGFIALLLAAVLLLIDNRYSNLRYKISVIAISVFVVSTLYTFFANCDAAGNLFSSTNSVSQSFEIQNLDLFENVKTEAANDNSNLYSTVKSYFQRNFPLLITFWFLGLLFFSLRFMGGLLFLQKIKTRGIKELNIEWIYRTRELTRRILVNKFVPVYESMNVTVPIVIGFLKPLILLPIGIVSGLPYKQVEAIIVHELAHIKRYDYLLNLLQSFIETVFFYHPAVWWISTRIREERENACDDMVLENCEDALVYSNALYNLQHVKSNQPNLALAAGGKVNQLLRRIKRMNGEKKQLSSGGRFAALIAVFLFIGAAVVISSASGNKRKANVAEASFINPISLIEGNSSNTIKFSMPDTTSIKKGKRTLKFNDDVNGEEKRFKAKLNNGKLEQLYIDGEEVQTKDFKKYEKQIAEKTDEYDSTMKEYNIKKGHYKESMNKFREEMNAFKEKMKNFHGSYRDEHDFDFEFDFDVPHVSIPHFSVPRIDSAERKEITKEIQSNLHKHFVGKSIKIPPIHIPEIHIPPINIPQIDLEELRHNLKEHEFDSEEFRESIKEMKEDLAIEMKKLNKELKHADWNKAEFKENLKHLSQNMDNLKADMKILKEYLNDVKAELVKDKLLDEEDDLDGFYLSKEEMKINGKKVSPELHKKYLEIYKKHYGKELSGDQKFQIND